MCDDTARPDNAPFSYMNSRTNCGSAAKPYLVVNAYWNCGLDKGGPVIRINGMSGSVNLHIWPKQHMLAYGYRRCVKNDAAGIAKKMGANTYIPSIITKKWRRDNDIGGGIGQQLAQDGVYLTQAGWSAGRKRVAQVVSLQSLRHDMRIKSVIIFSRNHFLHFCHNSPLSRTLLSFYLMEQTRFPNPMGWVHFPASFIAKRQGKRAMQQAYFAGLDIAKNVFQAWS